MKIAELFAVLGFKMDGAEKLETVKKEMTSIAGETVKGAIAVNAINVAFYAMIDTSMKAGQALRNFALSTGLSTEDLQLWQHVALVDGLAAEDLTAAIKALQSARAGFDLGNPQNLGAWNLLGVSPLQDPFKVITALRARLAGGNINPGVARNLLGQLGLESLLPLLKSSNAEFEKWSSNFILVQKQRDELARLNGAWQNLRSSIIAIKTQFAASFAPALTMVANGLQWVAEELAVVVRWLESASPIAAAVRGGLIYLAAVLSVVGVALAAISAAAAFAAAAIGLFSATTLAALPILGSIALIIGVAAGVIAGLILLIDDMWAAFTGGKSVLADLGDKIFGPFFQYMFDHLEALEKLWNRVFGNHEILTGSSFGNSFGKPASSSSNVRQDNNIKIDVNGAQDPRATGREVFSNIKAQIAAASYQAPVPSY